MQIGLTREQVNVEGELTLASLKEIACAFVDRKVIRAIYSKQIDKICIFSNRVYTFSTHPAQVKMYINPWFKLDISLVSSSVDHLIEG